jgi:hypothetical protein
MALSRYHQKSLIRALMIFVASKNGVATKRDGLDTANRGLGERAQFVRAQSIFCLHLRLEDLY